MAHFKGEEERLPNPGFVPAYDVKIIGGKKIIIWRDKNNNTSNNTSNSNNSNGNSVSNATNQYDRY
jgi:hypothetical protein